LVEEMVSLTRVTGERETMRGTMLWFNEVKDFGFIQTEEGERLSVLGTGFADGKRPVGRCADAVVSFEVAVNDTGRQAQNVVFVTEDAPRRARLRHRGGR
jgi:cold shock CspA family protein